MDGQWVRGYPAVEGIYWFKWEIFTGNETNSNFERKMSRHVCRMSRVTWQNKEWLERHFDIDERPVMAGSPWSIELNVDEKINGPIWHWSIPITDMPEQNIYRWEMGLPKVQGIYWLRVQVSSLLTDPLTGVRQVRRLIFDVNEQELLIANEIDGTFTERRVEFYGGKFMHWPTPIKDIPDI